MALPALAAAAKALDSIKQGDIAELKTIQKYHPDVLRVFQCVCILQGKTAVRVMDNATGKKEDDWIAPTKQLLNEAGLLKSLQNYDKDNMDPKKVEKI